MRQLGFVLGRQLKNLDVYLDTRFKNLVMNSFAQRMILQKEVREELNRGSGTTPVLYGRMEP